jgi:hypothetical protein
VPVTSAGAELAENVFWHNGADAVKMVPTDESGRFAEGEGLDIEAGRNRIADPRFVDPEGRDYSLRVEAGKSVVPVGVLRHIPFTSDWPVQPMERAYLQFIERVRAEQPG